jgi:hypothetical protein
MVLGVQLNNLRCLLKHGPAKARVFFSKAVKEHLDDAVPKIREIHSWRFWINSVPNAVN